MTPQQPSRARFTVTVILAAVMAAAAAGLVLSRAHPAAAVPPGSTAAPAASQPGKTQAQADLAAMQSALNSGSVARQAALLAPPLKFAPGSGPILPSGTTITVRPDTLHASKGQGTVQARLSDRTDVTLYLTAVKDHWRLHDARTGAHTTAKVTGQPVTARLMSATTWDNYVPTEKQIGQRWPVIFIHGIGGGGGDWGPVDPGTHLPTNPKTMIFQVNRVVGTYVLSFNYGDSGHWVTDPAVGPAFAKYIRQVAQVSRDAHGPGRVIIVAFSMGGLATRYAAYEGGEAKDIAMVTTIGTPNLGTPAASLRQFVCYNLITRPMIPPGDLQKVCQWPGADALTSFNHQIAELKPLPSTIPVLHAIAGNEFYIYSILGAHVGFPWGGDVIVPTWSALAKRPGGSPDDTYKEVMNPLIPGNFSAFHLNLQVNGDVIQLVTGYVADWIGKNPVAPYVPPQSAPQPSASAPALGGEAYWLADGGRWYVHGMTLQISRAAATNSEADLTGLFSWNDYQNTVWGHAVMRLSLQQDGSLAGTFVGSATYTLRDGSTAQGYAPQPDAPADGQAIHLVPVGPMHAKVEGGYFGNTNWCQAGLANASQYCGA